MTNIDVFREWHSRAYDDMRVAEHVKSMHPVPLEIICYQYQQAIEKILKAYLILNDCDIVKTHDLKKLCELCANFDPEFTNISNYASRLTRFAIQGRYPDECEITQIDVEVATKNAGIVFEFVMKKAEEVIALLTPTKDGNNL